MISIGTGRTGAPPRGSRLAALGVACILVAACAAPGAVATPSTAASAAPSTAAPSTSSEASAAAPSASAVAAGPSCGTDPVELNAYFETGFDLPFKLSVCLKRMSRFLRWLPLEW